SGSGGSALATSAGTISSGQVYRGEWMVDPSTNTLDLRIFEGEGTTPVVTLTYNSWTQSNQAYFTVGPAPTTSATGSIDFDTIKYADDWVGPDGEEDPGGGDLVPRVVVRRYNGSVWE